MRCHELTHEQVKGVAAEEGGFLRRYVCVCERMNQVIYIFFARTSSEIMFLRVCLTGKLMKLMSCHV